MKIVAACGAGMGTSMIMKLKVQKALKELGVEAEVEALSMGQSKNMVSSVDIIITSSHLASEFDATKKAKIASIKNIMSDQEIKEALKKALNL